MCRVKGDDNESAWRCLAEPLRPVLSSGTFGNDEDVQYMHCLIWKPLVTCVNWIRNMTIWELNFNYL